MSASRLLADRVLITGAALADGTSERLVRDVSLYVDHGVLVGLWTGGEQPELPDRAGITEIDGLGATIVPGMVDSHSHLSMPGGADWVNHGFDPLDTLLAVGEENGELMVRAGIRWARDVGSPRRLDPARGVERAASLLLRDRWHGHADRPYLRAAGTWLLRPGALPAGLGIEVEHGADLPAAVGRQLDDGADLVKLYLDGPDPATSPFSTAEVTAAVREAHGRGAKVAAHATGLAGNRVGAEAGVDSLEHGFQIDADIANLMVANDVTLVSTLAVMHSWRTFGATSTVPRFTDPAMRPRVDERLETAQESVRIADRAGAAIAAGSDFGGGSLRANQLVWEVESMVGAGIEPRAALAAATWRGGDLLGVPHAGRLIIGQPAHFSLVHGDPLSDPAALWRVWLTR